ncbi:MAG: hypothetical protein ACWGNV_14045 [Bacteroidales bacterium]
MNNLSAKILLLILLLFFLFPSSGEVHSCTIFYLKGDSVILAGNNEDWKDPNSIMSFYPGEDERLGWVKFGWGSGFPQGGMNEKGLFWDATAGPYLAMPYSEVHKVLYSGPLMKKVIEECATVKQAMELFSQYYCEDQYKAQYLVGDAASQAIIVEGDSVISMQEDHLVLTNFYHSHPELGGYPCTRYETACQMLEAGDLRTPNLIGAILEATHQEGKYPTQYSQIYDLKSQRFYLFYYYNFEEYILIHLNNELKKGVRSFNIANLFAGITLQSPENDELVSGSDIELTWKGKPGFQYELFYSTDPHFPEQSTSTITHVEAKTNDTPYLMIGFIGIVLSFSFIPKRKWILTIFPLMILSPLQCDREKPVEENETLWMTESVTNLEPGLTYFWKITAHPIQSEDFCSETLIRSFRTGN